MQAQYGQDEKAQCYQCLLAMALLPNRYASLIVKKMALMWHCSGLSKNAMFGSILLATDFYRSSINCQLSVHAHVQQV
jgi:hypothetical protein